MGIAKKKSDESAARGFNEINKFVCIKCIGNKFLRKTIRLNAASKRCEYCNKQSKNKNIAAPVNDIIALILEGLGYEWENPLNELSYISSDGGWQGEVFGAWDLSEYIQDEAEIENEILINDIRESLINREWCKPNGISWEEALSFSWNTFAKLIKHKYRYTFHQISEESYRDPYEDEFRYIPPNKILDVLGRIVNTYKELMIEIPKGTEIFRVRWFENAPDVSLLTAKQLGTPPQKNAIVTNRMSPSGIPLFYGTLHQQTALQETIKDEKSQYYAIAKFKTLTNLKILNLSSLSKMPSLFDKKNRGARQVVRFLRKFSNEISRPIERDGREHIEYAPTQMLSEYFRHIFRYKKQKLDGIFYPSSKMDGTCCALYVENENCVDKVDSNKSPELDIVQLIEATQYQETITR